ncbi:MAG: endonuclease VII domain-containing protein [Actinomycetota bacterium]|nr:endonuclease VII domain-containing protein [Actinomycetota bacterium]
MLVYHKQTICDLCRQHHHEWRYFSLTGAQARELRARKQCDICGSTDPRERRGFRIDHCHKTNQVRGVLCHLCNVALGAMHDDADRLRAAADYIEKHR